MTRRRTRYLAKAQELGIKNIHVHKGPTIWPLDKDAFDVADVDHAATDFPELNFIVEHVGLPRIEDFCFMATQEPNVYAGLAVVIGGLMHARPRFFAKVMGELLFWVGEDKITFGSDYAIWEPRWQIEGFVDWDYPESDDYDDYPRLGVEGKKKILGLNAARLYDIEVPSELPDRRIPPSRPSRRMPSWCRALRRRHERRVADRLDEAVLARPGHGPRPGARRAGDRRWASWPRATSPRDGTTEVHLRLPTYFCAPNFAFLMVADAYDAVSSVPGVTRAVILLDDHFAGERDQRRAWRPARGSSAPSADQADG